VRAGPKAWVDPSPLPLQVGRKRSVAVSRFARTYVRTPRGHGARRPLRLRPWQRELVAAVWDGRPRPRLAGWMLPRGQGKTSLTALLALYELTLGAEGAQVVVAACDERQAGICFAAARRMVELHPELERRVQVYQDHLYVPERGATFQVLPAVAKRLEGLDYSLALRLRTKERKRPRGPPSRGRSFRASHAARGTRKSACWPQVIHRLAPATAKRGGPKGLPRLTLGPRCSYARARLPGCTR
jgi:hypothetical protein